jgi:hypothetical protein
LLRRLGKEDLANVNPFLREQERHRRFLWRVYEDYEVINPEDGLPYLRAVKSDKDEAPRRVKVYNPLVDTPRLFLDFARLAERNDPGEALSGWIGQYGLLGLAKRSSRWIPEGTPDVVVPPLQYDDRGGSGETLEAVWYEVYVTNNILVLYEAVLNRDAGKLEGLLFGEGNPQWSGSGREHVFKRMRETNGGWTDALAERALSQIWEHLSALAVFAYPAITPARGSYPEPLLTVERMVATWGVRNLLGAMYLQFFWLVTSAGELSRCKHCGRIISYAPPIPAGEEHKARKPRKDKEYCDSRCRQNYHYHNRKKLGPRSNSGPVNGA